MQVSFPPPVMNTPGKIDSIPPEPGSYALNLHLANTQAIQIGRLGEFDFPAGMYIYVGSALGPGGLQARLSRHLRGSDNSHWHVDWLRARSDVTGYFFQVNMRRLECLWSQALLILPGVTIPVPRFGASDCRDIQNTCLAHLVHLESASRHADIRELLSKVSGADISYQKFSADSHSELGYIE